MIWSRNRRTRGIARLALVVLCLSSATSSSADDLRDEIDGIVQAEAGFDLFSGTVIVARHGEILYAEAVGEANKEHHVPNTLETRFNISSVQKSFIATVILQLVQSGQISLSDPLTKYFPDCPYPTADQIQISHLLNHSSGLADYRDNEEYQARAAELKNLDEVLPFLYALEPAFSPGEGFEYSNAGVLYLKAIIEHVTERRLNQALAERILQPLGMDNTAFHHEGQVTPGRATGYRLAPDGETYLRDGGEPSAYTGGGIYTTGLDLLRFDQALYREDLLDEQYKKVMFTPVGPDEMVAFGWFVVEYGGTTVISHSGGSGNFATEFRRYPEKGLTLVVNANYSGAGFELTNAIEALLLGLPYEIATEATLRFRHGMALQEAGEYREAAARFDENVQGEHPHLPSLYQAARTRILGEYEQDAALALLDRYLALAEENSQPSPAAAWWRKGVVYEQLTDLDQARACYRRSLELEPTFSLASEALQRLDKEQ